MDTLGIGSSYNKSVYGSVYARQRSMSASGMSKMDWKDVAEEQKEKAEAPKAKYDEKAFEYVGANAPKEVKQAWMEAADEAGVNGLGMRENGMLTHITKMMVKRLENCMNGTGRENDILGNTVQSAIRAAGKALYDLDHSLSPDSLRSIEVQEQLMKEREFYRLFLKKLDAQI